MCICDQVIPLNTEGERLRKILSVFIFIDIFFVLAKLVFLRADSLIGIISLSLLVVTYLSCHYIISSFLIFVLMYDFVIIFFFLLFRIQNSLSDFDDKFLTGRYYITIVIIEVLALGFDVLKIIVSFESYQNFRGSYLTAANYGSVPQMEEKVSEKKKEEPSLIRGPSIAGFTPLP